MLIYTDESGDLGWIFDQPYRNGGSSRHLTIASICIDPSIEYLPKRAIRRLYQQFKWNPKKEKKWADMPTNSRNWFANEALSLSQKQGKLVKYHAITVCKPNVQTHIRRDQNKLYNYMIGLSLLPEMSRHDSVSFFPDARTLKVSSGDSLHDYLQTQLWFEYGSKTRLATLPCNSENNPHIQFADMLAGLIQNHFEDNKSAQWETLQDVITHQQLFFP